MKVLRQQERYGRGVLGPRSARAEGELRQQGALRLWEQ